MFSETVLMKFHNVYIYGHNSKIITIPLCILCFVKDIFLSMFSERVLLRFHKVHICIYGQIRKRTPVPPSYHRLFKIHISQYLLPIVISTLILAGISTCFACMPLVRMT